MKKLIVSCFACSPMRGSEPGMGWHYVLALAKRYEIWVVLDKVEFEEIVTRYVTEHQDEMRNVHFVFVPYPPHPILRKIWPPSYYWFYKLWHWRAYRIARELHKKIGFDAAYKLNMATFRDPGYLWKLPIPFIWGPVGAMGITDWRLLGLMGPVGALEYLVRNVINTYETYTLKRSRLAARKASRYGALIAATSENLRMMHKVWGVNSTILCEIGVDQIPQKSEVSVRKNGETLRIVWSGLFERRKALPVLLRALSLLPQSINWKLDVLGKGPEWNRWTGLVSKLRLGDKVRFHGWVERLEAMEIMRAAHVLVISSIHDLTSSVLLEALGFGVPVICLNHCGFADVVDDSCGIRIPIGARSQMINGFADAIMRLCDESLRQRLSAGAVSRLTKYYWPNKAKMLYGIIDEAIEQDEK